MNPTYFAIELRRIVRDVVTMFFVAILPAVLYLIFARASRTARTAWATATSRST